MIPSDELNRSREIQEAISRAGDRPSRVSPPIPVLSVEELQRLVQDLGSKTTLTNRLEVAVSSYAELVQRYNDLHRIVNETGRAIRAGQELPAEAIALWEAMRAADHQAGRPWDGD